MSKTFRSNEVSVLNLIKLTYHRISRTVVKMVDKRLEFKSKSSLAERLFGVDFLQRTHLQN